MNISEFNLLTFDQRCQVIESSGIYIAGKNEDHLAYNLYAVFSFYVELCFNFADNYLDHMKIFKNSEFLEPYIEDIHLQI